MNIYANRAERRAGAKALLCVSRRSKIPGGVAAKLGRARIEMIIAKYCRDLVCAAKLAAEIFTGLVLAYLGQKPTLGSPAAYAH